MVAVENIEKSTSRAVELSSIKHSWIKVVSPGSHCLLLQGGSSKSTDFTGCAPKSTPSVQGRKCQFSCVRTIWTTSKSPELNNGVPRRRLAPVKPRRRRRRRRADPLQSAAAA